MNKVSNIKIFTCGGTFEKVYDPISGELTFKNSIIEELVAISRVTIPINTEKIMLIDSLEMNKEHREKCQHQHRKYWHFFYCWFTVGPKQSSN